MLEDIPMALWIPVTIPDFIFLASWFFTSNSDSPIEDLTLSILFS
jgi:hypothetical protein